MPLDIDQLMFTEPRKNAATIQVRRRTFQDVVDEIPILDLPVAYEGSYKDCRAYCEAQPGYIWIDSRLQLAGGYYYNKAEATVLLLT